MRRKELIVINTFLIGLVAIFSILTVSLSINQSIPSLIADLFKTDNVQAQVQQNQEAGCMKKAPLSLANIGDDQYLTKLKEYQQVCQSFVTNTLMVFTGFPQQDGTTATADASVLAKELTSLHQAGITPIVIAEPYDANGAVSYRDFINGAYDQSIDTYFSKLHDLGVTDQIMGTWVPFPESNTPNWNNKDTTPSDFATCVNKYLGTLRKYFPSTKGSVLLDATTYDPNDLEYNNGNYLDLTPYLTNIDKTLVESIGIQGFPWVSNATTTRREIFSASEFLQPDLAIGAARELHTRDIWFNTGTFAAKYTNNKSKLVTISANSRRAILSDILNTAHSVQNYQQNTYRVSINLFSEDKSSATEATDWSYFQDADSKTILKDFVSQADNLSMPISLYDKTK